MNEQIPQTAEVQLPENNTSARRFTATGREAICALLSYIPAFLYAKHFCSPGWQIGVTALLLIVITELLNLNRRRSAESYVWLGCLVLCTCSFTFKIGTAWSDGQKFTFIHIFYVWWILSRSGKLLEGKSGHLLPADALNAFILLPFPNFFLRIRSLFFGICRVFSKRSPEKNRGRVWMIPAALLCVLLFVRAAGLLMKADSSFDGILRGITDFFRVELDFGDFFGYLLLSLPIGAWLFGLMAGSARMPEEKLVKQRSSIDRFLLRIRKVPVGFWIAAVGLFSLLYLGFFVLQGSYLFGAFTRTLPEGFIVSQYAREGFFEMCRVMAVNFSLLWLVTRMACADAYDSRLFRAFCLILMLESMLFAVIAFTKLYLYISCFGFTPRRLQSMWLICVLFAGCLLWIYKMVRGRTCFRAWMYFGAVTLSVLTLV